MKVLRRVIRIGSSKLVTLPREIELGDYVWIEAENGKLVIKRAEVR